MTRMVGMPDGRDVAVECWGAPNGMPIFLLHGTPGSRYGPRPRASILYRLGVRLISYDRPGYGGSDPDPGRTVADAADDIEAIAKDFDLDSFGVVGRSGGGPHALACAALLPDRVQSAAVLVSLAPSDAKNLNWYEGMAESNVDEYCVADADPAAVRARLDKQAAQVRGNPEIMFDSMGKNLTDRDRRVVDDVAIRRQLTDTYAEAVKHGAAGWADDVLALRQPWGFELSKIEVPVLLWHGADDVFSPVTHTAWLAKKIPGAVMKVQPGAAHFEAVEVLPQVLGWMKDARKSERVWV